jgi:cardiolipin synthase
MIKYFAFIPNLLSIIRIGLVYPILNNIYLLNYKISLIIFVIASITDAMDGYLARKLNWQSELGKILDPVADKLLLSGTIFVLWLNDLIPFYIFFILITRDIIILLGAAFQMTLTNSMAPYPNFLGKFTTIILIVYIAIILLVSFLNQETNLLILEFFISCIAIFSLVTYALSWIKHLKSLNE